jgi:hypothetical protein
VSGSPGNPANRVPNAPDDDVARQLRQIRQEITELKAARGAQLFVLDQTQTIALARIGRLPDDPLYNHPDTGQRQEATVFKRDDGTYAFTIAELAADIPGDPYSQAVAIWDKSGNIIISEDSDSGFGHARPHVPIALQNSDVSTWPATSSTSFTDIADCFMELQQPKLSWIIYCYADTGAVGEYRITVNGTQFGATHSLNGSVTNFDEFSDSGDLTTLGLDWGTPVLVALEARLALGTGHIKARQLLITGTQS